jgi:hypothetical protein
MQLYYVSYNNVIYYVSYICKIQSLETGLRLNCRKSRGLRTVTEPVVIFTNFYLLLLKLSLIFLTSRFFIVHIMIRKAIAYLKIITSSCSQVDGLGIILKELIPLYLHPIYIFPNF